METLQGVVGTPSPYARLIDNFGGVTLDPSWLTSRDDSVSPFSLPVVSGGVVEGPGATSQSVYWSGVQYGPDCEVSFTVVAKPTVTGDNVHMGLRLQSPGVDNSLNGYQLYLIVEPSTGDDIIRILRRDAGVATQLVNVTREYNVGEIWKLRAVGSTISALVSADSGVTWTTVSSTTDATYGAAGFFGFGGRGTTYQLDAFTAVQAPGYGAEIDVVQAVKQTAQEEIDALNALFALATEPVLPSQGLNQTAAMPRDVLQGLKSDSGRIQPVEALLCLHASAVHPFESNATAVSQIGVLPYDSVKVVAASTAVLRVSSMVGVAAKTVLLPVSALGGVRSVAAIEYETAQGIAFVHETLRGLRGTSMMPLDVLGGVRSLSGTDPSQTGTSGFGPGWPFFGGGAGPLSAMWVDALQPIAKTGAIPVIIEAPVRQVSGPFPVETLAPLAVVIQTAAMPIETISVVQAVHVGPLESLLKVMKNVSPAELETLEALTGVATQALLVVEALQGARQTALAPVSALRTLQRTLTLPSSSLTGVAAVAGAYPADTVAALVAVAAARVDAAGRLASLAGVPAETVRALVQQAIARTDAQQALAAAAAGITEALAGLRQTDRMPVETLGLLAQVVQTGDLPYDTMQPIAATLAIPEEAVRPVAQQQTAPAETGAAVKSTAAAPAETLTRVTAQAVERVDSLRSILANTLTPFESIVAVAATRGVPAETLSRVVFVAAPQAVEALHGVAATDAIEIASDAVVVSVIQTGVLHIDAPERVPAIRPVPVESIRPVTSQAGLTLEALIGVAVRAGVPADSVIGGIAAVGGPLRIETVEGLRSLGQQEIDALHGLTVVVPLPTEWVAGFHSIQSTADIQIEAVGAVVSLAVMQLDGEPTLFGFITGYVIADATGSISDVPDAAADGEDRRA